MKHQKTITLKYQLVSILLYISAVAGGWLMLGRRSAPRSS
jgi:hypothetical protein